MSLKTKVLTVSLCLLLGSCAHKQVGGADAVNTGAAASGSVPSEPESFRVGDEKKGPQVVDEELQVIPTEINPSVEKWIAYFQGRGRGHMERYMARSTRYEALMKKVLKDNKLPEDLFYIALIESGFSSSALSHASAVGYWQFIRGTGKRFGLEINQLVDERRDPVIATQAAAEYFKDLYSEFGSWYLAMASYNVGEGKVRKAIAKHKTRDFWELSKKRRVLPKETLNYVPKYIAAKLIAKNPDKYGFEGIDYLPPIEFDHVAVQGPVNLRLMADKMGMNYEDLKALNPKFKGEVAPLKGSTLELRIPPGTTEQATVAAAESIVEKAEFIADDNARPYKVRRGDTVYSIARRYRTTVAYIRDMNDLPRRKRLRPGMTLYVPDRTPLAEKRPEYVAQKVRPSRNNQVVEISSAEGRFYIVQPGDSFYSIAKKYNVSVNSLKRANNLRRGNKLKAGSRLILPSEASSTLDSQKKTSGTSGLREKSTIRKMAGRAKAKKVEGKRVASAESRRSKTNR